MGERQFVGGAMIRVAPMALCSFSARAPVLGQVARPDPALQRRRLAISSATAGETREKAVCRIPRTSRLFDSAAIEHERAQLDAVRVRLDFQRLLGQLVGGAREGERAPASAGGSARWRAGSRARCARRTRFTTAARCQLAHPFPSSTRVPVLLRPTSPSSRSSCRRPGCSCGCRSGSRRSGPAFPCRCAW